MTTKEFIEKSNKIHNYKYDYSKSEYIDSETKICIICPEHGEFWQIPYDHIKGHGCMKCAKQKLSEKYRMNFDTFVSKSNELHRNRYDYSKVNYINNRSKVCIICPEHGEFWQTPDSHLRGRKCPVCALNERSLKRSSTTEEFIKKAKEIHGDKYDYSKVEYKNALSKVCITCPEHGEFWQTPSRHLKHDGCPICRESKMESTIKLLFSRNNIVFVQHCGKNILKWLDNQHLDFYLPDYNIAIECQGEQHFRKIGRFGGEEKLIKDIDRDERKNTKCKENGVKIFYILPDKKVNTSVSKIYNTENTIKLKEKNNLLKILK